MRKVAERVVTRAGVKMMTALGAVAALVLGMVVLAFPASAHTGGPTYSVRQILSGQRLHHWYTRAGSGKQQRESLTQPDDITMTGGHLFTGFQNDVGPQGQASTDGNRDSTIVEFAPNGTVIHQWDIRGKCDGLTADPYTGQVIPPSTKTRTPACTASTRGAARSRITRTASRCRITAAPTPSPSTTARC